MASKAAGSGHADPESRKRCIKNVTQIGSSCRDDIICDKGVSKGFKLEPAGGTAPWREEFTLLIVRHSLQNEWREVFKSTSEKVKAKYPLFSNEITETVERYLLKSPMQDFKKAIAYRWLKYLETNPPVDSCWYPDSAVDVAHKVFF